MAERTDQVGQRFGDYWLRRRLGGGGFGDVYLGEHVQTKSLAAVKVLHIRLTRSEDLRAFINEVRTFRLQHPHIVRVLDVGIASDETPFLVMAYAPNGTLRDQHPKGTRLLLSTVLAYVVPLASALQYAHDLHVVHRDVKPENMLLGVGEVLWLSDFGIATVAHSTGSLTTEGMGGTLPYMAPEQIQGRPRPQSDQYALAIVVYEWLTGTWPFRGTPIEIAMQHQMTPPPALRIQVPELAPEVEHVVLTALAKEPKQRFASVLDFARAFEQAYQAGEQAHKEEEERQRRVEEERRRRDEKAMQAREAEQERLRRIIEEEKRRQAEEAEQARLAEEVYVHAVEEQTSPKLPPPFPSTPSPREIIPPQSPTPLSFIASSQPTSPSQSSTTLPLPLTPRQTQRRPSPAVTVVLVLLALMLLGGVSFAIYHLLPQGNWTTQTIQTSGTSQVLYSVVWSGSQFVAVGSSGTILTSPDGHTWTTQTSGTSNSLYGVAWSSSGSQSEFVAVGNDGTILASPDGHTWTTQRAGTRLPLVV